MIIRLSLDDIVKHWDKIKFAIVKVFDVSEEDVLSITNIALGELLANNYQCFFKLNDEGSSVEVIVITSIILNKFTGLKSLSIECLYSFKLQKDWTEFFSVVKHYGKENGCINKDGKIVILGCSNNQRVKDIMLGLGFEETLTTFTYVGG
jgi:hypothetical protein